MKRSALSDVKKLIVYTDGGARGNPGPAAIGVVINGKEYGEYIGERTNNQAEYEGVVFALKKIKQLIGKDKSKQAELLINMDSELVVRQLNGEYRIEEGELKPLFVDVWNLKMNFKKIEFIHIPREQNKIADRIVNKVLDSRMI